jgi:hypothetical protein
VSPRSGPALGFHGRQGGIGLATLRRFLDRAVNLICRQSGAATVWAAISKRAARSTSSPWPNRVARYFTGPRSASTFRRSPSTAAFSIFRSATALASTVGLSKAALGLPPFVVRGAGLGGCGEGCRLGIDGWGGLWVLVLGASAALRICNPSVPASPADRYCKGGSRNRK